MFTLFSLGHTLSHASNAPGRNSNDISAAIPSRKSQRIHVLETLVAVLLPWLLFVLILSLFVFALEQLAPLVWALFAAGMLLALLLVVTGETCSRNWRLGLGTYIACSLGLAVPIGLFIEHGHMRDYWRLDNGAEYSNVDPLSSSSSRSDGTVIQFQKGTQVDPEQGLGFMKAGVVYCVAPVVNRQWRRRKDAPIQYWAAGTGCCQHRGDFACNDVEDSGAMGGLTILDTDGTYRKAVRMAESVYDFPPSENSPILLQWVRNAMVSKDGLWYGAASMVMVATAVHLVMSGIVGLLIMRYMPK